MPRIIDNIKLHLRPTLKETLEHSAFLDTCVGYFNLRGWSALCEDVDALSGDGDRPAVRLLVGMQDSPESKLRDQLRIIRRQTTIDNATAARLRQAAAQGFREQLTWGIPSSDDERVLRTLRRQLAEGRVQVRLFLQHNLHAKLYLCHRADPVNPRVGFVGSSNLTFSGLGGQGELNVDVMDHDATEKLHDWFERRWDDRLTVDITDELIRIIDESWAANRDIDPYLIHLKLAWHLSRDARAGLVEFGLPHSMQRKLLKYQEAAVKITARNLMARGGAMIGDVVGLGKTIVAAAISLVLQEEHGFESLIVCPKNLVKMWQGYVDTYRLHARVVSLSLAKKELEGLRRYRLLIIDESHNLRNEKRQDYVALRDYIQRNDPRVLLLTATPFNTSMVDVASQLGLFVDTDRDLGVRPEAAIARMGEIDFLARCDDKPSTLRAFRLSEEPEDWQRLLAQFLVRRTRKFIRDNYAKLDPENGRYYLTFGSGERHYLPDRVPKPLSHDSLEDDPASDMASADVLAAIDELQLPRYDLASYIAIPEGEELHPQERQLLKDLDRAAGNLIGFTRTMLMKRLSSSGAVFILSLQRHLLRNFIYVRGIKDDAYLPIGSVDDSQLFDDSGDALGIPVPDGEQLGDLRTASDWEQLAESAYRILEEKAPAGVTWVRAALFKETLLKALDADNNVILELLSQFGNWDHWKDAKVDALCNLLTSTHKQEKVLVFSEYADTAEYVTEALIKRGIDRIASVTGAAEDPTTLARRFSPESNSELGPAPEPEDELRVLVATDVLSEGQNLQDSAIVVNFDLPWAIIKLIQRAGRVDRIGQKADRVLVYTMLPQEGVESVLRLRSRVAERLAKNASVFGSDERFLNTPDEAQLIQNLFDENAEYPEGETEQVDFASAAYEIWRHAEEEHPDLAAAAVELPNVSYSTLPANEGQVSGVVVYTQSNFGVDRIGLAPTGEPPARLSPMEALVLTSCDPATPPAPRLHNHHGLVESVIEGPLSTEEASSEGALTGVRRRVYERVRNHIADREGVLFSADSAVEEAIDALHRSPLTEQAKQALARALRERTPGDLAALVAQLHDEGRLTIDTSTEPDDIFIVCSMGIGPAA